MKAKPWKADNGSGVAHPHQGYKIFCEGCKNEHYIYTTNPGGPTWGFNGDLFKPTFTPSVRITWPERQVQNCCHFIITDGMIEFCGDCTHKLAGRKLELPDIK